MFCKKQSVKESPDRCNRNIVIAFAQTMTKNIFDVRETSQVNDVIGQNKSFKYT